LGRSAHLTQDTMRSRVGTLAGMVDEALEDRRAG